MMGRGRRDPNALWTTKTFVSFLPRAASRNVQLLDANGKLGAEEAEGHKVHRNDFGARTKLQGLENLVVCDS